MPTLQVLEREPDKRSEILLQVGQNIANQIHQSKMRDIMKAQNEAAIKNAQNEAEKIKQQRVKSAWELVESLAPRVGGDAAMGIAAEHYPDEIMPAVERAGINMKWLKTGKERLAEEQANMLQHINQDQGFGQRRLPSGADVQTNEQGLPVSLQIPQGIEDERLQMSRSLPPLTIPLAQTQEDVQGEVFAPEQSARRSRFENTALNIGGMSFVDPYAQARAEAMKKEAVNEADLRTGKFTTDESAVIGSAPSAISSLDKAINRISSGKLSGLQKVAIDMKSPYFAGKDIQDIQTELNNVKMVLNKMMSFGTQFTESEQRLVNAVTDLGGKTPENIKSGLGYIRDIFQRKVDVIKKGRAMLWDESAPKNDATAAFMATAIEKGFSQDKIATGLQAIQNALGKGK
jgi:hypothetical protein